VRQFKLSNDPQFITKLRDIVGLYVNLPERCSLWAAVLNAQHGASNVVLLTNLAEARSATTRAGFWPPCGARSG
jgi:hypothetical protein